MAAPHLQSLVKRLLGIVSLALLAATPAVLPGTAEAQTRDHLLRWIPPPEPDVAGYELLIGTSPGVYGAPVALPVVQPVSGVSSYLITGLAANVDYYMVLRAVDYAQNVSPPSNEIVVAAAACTQGGCDDGNSCTADSCGTNGCVNTPVSDGLTCDDGNSGTFADSCQAGTCVGLQCTQNSHCVDPDGNVCTGTPVCSGNMCVGGAPLLCSATGSACMVPICDPITGCGQIPGNVGGSCDDGNAGTFGDTCDTSGMCVGTPVQCTVDADCVDPDNDVCTGVPVCSNFQCTNGAPLTCNGQFVCADEVCDAVAGCVVQQHMAGTPCDDGDPNTGSDVCDAGGMCLGTAISPPLPFGQCSTVFGPPDAPRLSWTDDTDTTMTVVWKAPLKPSGAELRFQVEGSGQWFSIPATVHLTTAPCTALYRADLQGLSPMTRYQYSVSGEGPAGPIWSPLETFETAPALGQGALLQLAFVASVGTPGATASDAAGVVLNTLRNVSPHVILGGGGYAYSNEVVADGLAPDADTAVDQWLDSLSGAASRSPFMPVMGDTEVASFTHGEQTFMYHDRHPLIDDPLAPEESYSYDVGNVHFLAIHAPDVSTLLPSQQGGASHLGWIDSDLADARTRGMRWLVVYMHADLYSGELGSPVNASVQAALSAIFESHGVSLVLSGDGNSYERSWPLVAGNAVNTMLRTGPYQRGFSDGGVTYLHAGSGGRTAFAPWADPLNPPAWTAVRDNAQAQYVLMYVLWDKVMLVYTIGVDPASGQLGLLEYFPIR